jgi:hypothetical protein
MAGWAQALGSILAWGWEILGPARSSGSPQLRQALPNALRLGLQVLQVLLETCHFVLFGREPAVEPERMPATAPVLRVASAAASAAVGGFSGAVMPVALTATALLRVALAAAAAAVLRVTPTATAVLRVAPAATTAV